MTLPDVPASFYWTEESWGPALRCRAMDPLAQHLCTGRQLQLPSAEACRALASAVGVAADHVVSMNQVHGRDVVTVRGAVPRERPEADALISRAPDGGLVG